MRWEALFADMEAQMAAAEAAEVVAQVAEVTRAERATVTLVGRLRAAHDVPVSLRVRGGEVVAGVVLDVADQWVLVGDGPRRALVPTVALDAVVGLPPVTHPDEGVVGRRLGLGHVLRALARDRAPVRVTAGEGQLVGRVERVAADHVDLTVTDDVARARGTRAAQWSVPFAALRVVRSG